MDNNLEKSFFLERLARIKETFVYNKSTMKLQSDRNIFMYFSFSKIIAQFLSGGQIIHSIFKILIYFNKDLFYNIKKNT